MLICRQWKWLYQTLRCIYVICSHLVLWTGLLSQISSDPVHFTSAVPYIYIFPSPFSVTLIYIQIYLQISVILYCNLWYIHCWFEFPFGSWLTDPALITWLESPALFYPRQHLSWHTYRVASDFSLFFIGKVLTPIWPTFLFPLGLWPSWSYAQLYTPRQS